MWIAAKNIKRLKQCIIYMFAYFMLQESEHLPFVHSVTG